MRTTYAIEEIEMNAIEARGLTKAYGDVPVLRGVDLSVAAGSVFALLGPNGAGKTTTVRILATLLAADGGTARVAGHNVAASRAAVRGAIALTGQHAAVDDRDPVGQDVGLLEVLGGEEDGHAAADELGDHVPHVRAAARVQAGRRLVEEEHVGLDD
jgi:ABC-2 type transport system ATP-binding protein